jgi:hypothetical protein
MSERENESMRDVSHTHPYTGETFGAVYKRGPAVADGGKSGTPSRESKTLGDVDHTPPHGGSANAVWERGEEHEDETVASDGGTGPAESGVGDE